MTVTKSSENYQIQDTVNDVNVTGNATVNANGDISLNLNTEDGAWMSYSENADGRCSLNINYNKDNDPTDYAQAAIASALAQLKGNN